MNTFKESIIECLESWAKTQSLAGCPGSSKAFQIAVKSINEQQQEIDQLKAQVERLRNIETDEPCYLQMVRDVLDETPAQSLAEHDADVIEEAIELCATAPILGEANKGIRVVTLQHHADQVRKNKQGEG